jgi:hypothetical protein
MARFKYPGGNLPGSNEPIPERVQPRSREEIETAICEKEALLEYLKNLPPARPITGSEQEKSALAEGDKLYQALIRGDIETLRQIDSELVDAEKKASDHAPQPFGSCTPVA